MKKELNLVHTATSCLISHSKVENTDSEKDTG